MRRVYNKHNQLRYLPSIEELEQLDEEMCGFCIGCGSMSTPAEPDARRLHCDECEKDLVFGAAELAILGACY